MHPKKQQIQNINKCKKIHRTETTKNTRKYTQQQAIKRKTTEIHA